MSDQTTDTTVDTTVVETPAVAPEAPAQAQLQLQDILAAAQMIQLASTRGAFRAEEFTTVGGVYERLVGFLQASGAVAPATDESPAVTDTPAE
jgi:hypothetical protein